MAFSIAYLGAASSGSQTRQIQHSRVEIVASTVSPPALRGSWHRQSPHKAWHVVIVFFLPSHQYLRSATRRHYSTAHPHPPGCAVRGSHTQPPALSSDRKGLAVWDLFFSDTITERLIVIRLNRNTPQSYNRFPLMLHWV